MVYFAYTFTFTIKKQANHVPPYELCFTSTGNSRFLQTARFLSRPPPPAKLQSSETLKNPRKKQRMERFFVYMGVSENRGGPPKWMVKMMDNPIFNGMIWGSHYFWKHSYDSYVFFCEPTGMFLCSK